VKWQSNVLPAFAGMPDGHRTSVGRSEASVPEDELSNRLFGRARPDRAHTARRQQDGETHDGWSGPLHGRQHDQLISIARLQPHSAPVGNHHGAAE
jgi:hypothetical protein